MRDLNREEPPGRRLAAAGALALAALAAALGLAMAAARAPEQAQPAGGASAQGEPAAARPVGGADGDEDGGAPQDGAGEGDGGGAQAPRAASPGREWAESIEGGDMLADLPDADLDDLYEEAYWYLNSTAYGDGAALECAQGPTPSEGAHDAAVYLKVAGTRTYLACGRRADGTGWDVVQLMREVEGVNDADEAAVGAAGLVDETDAESLRAVLGEAAGGCLFAQLGAWVRSGERGVPGLAYLDAGSVSATDGGLSCTVVYGAVSGSAAPDVETRASWDAASSAWSFEWAPAGQ